MLLYPKIAVFRWPIASKLTIFESKQSHLRTSNQLILTIFGVNLNSGALGVFKNGGLKSAQKNSEFLYKFNFLGQF